MLNIIGEIKKITLLFENDHRRCFVYDLQQSLIGNLIEKLFIVWKLERMARVWAMGTAQNAEASLHSPFMGSNAMPAAQLNMPNDFSSLINSLFA